MKLGTNLLKTLLPALAAAVIGSAACAEGTDKTLVSWVCLVNTTQQGGSALTIQSGDHFDGIVFGEKVAGKWMAGSEMYARTQGDQQANAVEKVDDKTPVQMSAVYKGSQVTIYRNGEPYASYEANNIDLTSAKDNMAVFGLRHVGAGSGSNLQGSIDDARIYDRALTAEEIRQLEPNKESAIKPYAWWTFEKDMETDRMGRFPVNNLDGGAKIEGGRLILTQNGELIAATKKLADMAETPAMPANPPADWLTYHLAHPGPGGAFPGDPNCAFYWKGRYHLHYIYNNHGVKFAHVSSTDMVHWTWHPTTLTPKFTGHGMYSGTGFITKDGKPAIIYHGEGSDRNQLAFALDDQLEQWTKPVAIMPKEPSGEDSKVRQWDPDCWLNGDTYYGISGGGPSHLMKSKDLKDWVNLGLLMHDDMPVTLGVNKGEDVSCANMFKLGNKWMLLCISHQLGCRYYLGDFKDEKYLPDFHAMMNWQGWDFFAPESVLTPDGRRVMWSWCNLPGVQSGIQSLPRELSLPEDGVLRIKPLRELETLRAAETVEPDITVKADSTQLFKKIAGDTIELNLTIEPGSAKEFGVNVFCAANGTGFPITIQAESKKLAIGKIAAPFELKPGEALNLRVFLDKGMVEVFANDRQAVVYMQPHNADDVGVSLFSKDGDIAVKNVRSWKMKSIYPEGKPKENNQATEEPVKGTSSADGTMLRDKTLVAWVRLADLVQTGSGVLAIQDGDEFDAITFGERAAARWMAGSENFSRTQSPAEQQSLAQEAATPDQWLQVAVVYRGKQIEIWRDGHRYAAYEAANQQTYPAKSDLYLGLRCLQYGYLKGVIDEARIYDTALDGEALAQLKPGILTVPKPLGWWTFDGGSVKDGMGHYPDARLIGTAKIKAGALVLDGQGYAHVSDRPPTVHAGFFTPSRKGQIWDTWAYFHEGRYYLYYLAGHFNRWDGHELALSDDGVHWKEQGVLIKPREGVTWMGTGHIWKSPDFDRNHTWVINYSEWFGDKQDIMFATSTNLLDWTKVDEKHRFVQDTRWYKEKGRWDCIDTVQRPDGSLYGYFTADPDPGKVTYRPCGFGFAESKDGITWTALPPIEGDISGEFGGIQKIGKKYYIIVSEGRVAVGDKPEGPFLAQKKNSNVFGTGCDIYFPRFFHSAPGGPLVNHFYTSGAVSAAPFKDVEIDREGILRLKWWKSNDGLKANPVKISLVPAGEGYFPSLKMLDWKPDPARTTVIEGTIVGAVAGTGDAVSPRIFFDQGGGKGQCLVFSKDEVAFGNIDAAGGEFKPAQTSARGMEFGAEARFRLLIREDMIELYVNDYLMNLKRVSYNGRIGFTADDRQGAFKDISVWQSK
jgi:sucrose-6-phosphate hydrolase SacC (GH32 family)